MGRGHNYATFAHTTRMRARSLNFAASSLSLSLSLSLSYISVCTASRMQIPFITLVSTHAQWICVGLRCAWRATRVWSLQTTSNPCTHTPRKSMRPQIDTPHSAKVLLIKLQFICGYHKKMPIYWIDSLSGSCNSK
jgi:hypothetical protein